MKTKGEDGGDITGYEENNERRRPVGNNTTRHEVTPCKKSVGMQHANDEKEKIQDETSPPTEVERINKETADKQVHGRAPH